MVRVGVLGEDDELAHIVGPVAQRVKVERAPERLRRGRGLNTGERIAVSHAPPSLHVVTRRLAWTRRPGPYTDSNGGKARPPQLAALYATAHHQGSVGAIRAARGLRPSQRKECLRSHCARHRHARAGA